jgi:hypothetical protein
LVLNATRLKKRKPKEIEREGNVSEASVNKENQTLCSLDFQRINPKSTVLANRVGEQASINKGDDINTD